MPSLESDRLSISEPNLIGGFIVIHSKYRVLYLKRGKKLFALSVFLDNRKRLDRFLIKHPHEYISVDDLKFYRRHKPSGKYKVTLSSLYLSPFSLSLSLSLPIYLSVYLSISAFYLFVSPSVPLSYLLFVLFFPSSSSLFPSNHLFCPSPAYPPHLSLRQYFYFFFLIRFTFPQLLDFLTKSHICLSLSNETSALPFCCLRSEYRKHFLTWNLNNKALPLRRATSLKLAGLMPFNRSEHQDCYLWYTPEDWKRLVT